VGHGIPGRLRPVSESVQQQQRRRVRLTSPVVENRQAKTAAYCDVLAPPFNRRTAGLGDEVSL
jgi:hypothetical protein